MTTSFDFWTELETETLKINVNMTLSLKINQKMHETIDGTMVELTAAVVPIFTLTAKKSLDVVNKKV